MDRRFAVCFHLTCLGKAELTRPGDNEAAVIRLLWHRTEEAQTRAGIVVLTGQILAVLSP